MWLYVYQLLLVLLLLQSNVKSQDDPPEYTKFYDNLYSMSIHQTYTFIYDVFQLKDIKLNPSITPWLYDDDPMHPNILISGCDRSGYACSYYVMSIGKYENDWTIVKQKDYFECFTTHGGVGRKPLKVEDIRLYKVGDSTRITYVYVHDTHHQYYHSSQLYYDKKLDALYILDGNRNRMSIEHEVGVKSQKNWSAFTYKFKNHTIQHTNDTITSIAEGNSSLYNVRANDTIATRNGHIYREMVIDNENLFVYSYQPHRIIHGNESMHILGHTQMHTVSISEIISPPMSSLWKWGEIRGGTPSVLIDTIYGKRYFALFHSSCRCSMKVIVTYFMGGYLFNVEPPFAITHMSIEPIIPPKIYNVTNGWAYKSVDYVVFPGGLYVKDDVAYVSLGRNDNHGWVMTMNVSAFIATLIPVQTKVLKDTFFEHISLSTIVIDDVK